MAAITSIIVFAIALTWKWLSYWGLYPGQEIRILGLALAAIAVPLLLLLSWYLVLFVLEKSIVDITSLRLRMLEAIWIAIVITRLRYPFIDGLHTIAIDNIFSITLFVTLLIFHRWIATAFNKLFCCYEEAILTEFGIGESAYRSRLSLTTRISLFLFGTLILTFIFDLSNLS